MHVGIQHFDRLVCDLAPSLNLELESAFKLGIPRFALTLKLVSATPVDIDAGMPANSGSMFDALLRSTSARSSSPFAV